MDVLFAWRLLVLKIMGFTAPLHSLGEGAQWTQHHVLIGQRDHLLALGQTVWMLEFAGMARFPQSTKLTKETFGYCYNSIFTCRQKPFLIAQLTALQYRAAHACHHLTLTLHVTDVSFFSRHCHIIVDKWPVHLVVCPFTVAAFLQSDANNWHVVKQCCSGWCEWVSD